MYQLYNFANANQIHPLHKSAIFLTLHLGVSHV